MSLPFAHLKKEHWKPPTPIASVYTLRKDLQSLERTHRFSDTETATQAKDLFAVIAIAALFLFLFLGRRPLIDWDEAIYADIAREFSRGVSHLAPFWNYHPWLERTPLFEWLTAALFSAFGISNFTARAVSAAAGCATAALCFIWAQRTAGRLVAWIAVTILLTTHAFFYQARFGTTDMLLSLWMFVSAYGIFRVDEGERKGWYAFWAGLALGIMTKSAGPAPVVLTLIIIALSRQWRSDRFGKQFSLALLLFIVIVAPWHVYMFAHYGRAFYDDYIVRQLLTRSLRPLEGHTGGPLFYLETICKSSFPWCLLIVPALVHFARKRRLSVLGVYAGVIFLFYTPIGTKLPWYITAIYPPLAIVEAKQLARWLVRPRLILPAFLVVGLAGLLFVDLRRPYARPEILLIAQHADAPGDKLILYSDQYILDTPAALFYADRPTVQGYLNRKPNVVEGLGAIDPVTNDPKFRNPQPLNTLVGQHDSLLLAEGILVPQLKTAYVFQPISSSGRFTLGIIHLR